MVQFRSIPELMFSVVVKGLSKEGEWSATISAGRVRKFHKYLTNKQLVRVFCCSCSLLGTMGASSIYDKYICTVFLVCGGFNVSSLIFKPFILYILLW